VEGADALGLIAEVGIAIAGFAGVIATLRAPGGTLGAFAAMRIGSLLSQSAFAVLLALLPFAFHQAGLADTAIWTLSSAAMLTLVAMLNLSFVFTRKTWLSLGEQMRGIRILAPIFHTITIAIVISQIANVAFIRELWPFYAGLLIITAASLINFAYILLAPARAELPA
jgi:hypothetical protein